MAEYRLDVRPFLHDIGGGTHVSDTLDIGTLVVGDESFESVEPARFDVSVSNAGEAIVAIGSVVAPVRATCVRCLCDFETEIHGEFEGFWPRPGQDAPDDTEMSGEVDDVGTIDLAPALVAALVVEAPFAPLHQEECKGLCTSCGQDLNVGSCDCGEPVDEAHPFAALRELLDDGSTEKPE
jgi:uncharacterized protein